MDMTQDLQWECRSRTKKLKSDYKTKQILTIKEQYIIQPRCKDTRWQSLHLLCTLSTLNLSSAGQPWGAEYQEDCKMQDALEASAKNKTFIGQQHSNTATEWGCSIAGGLVERGVGFVWQDYSDQSCWIIGRFRKECLIKLKLLMSRVGGTELFCSRWICRDVGYVWQE